jgi:protein TonB
MRPGTKPDGQVSNVTALTTRTSAEKLAATTPAGGVPPSSAFAPSVLVALTQDARLIETLRKVAQGQHAVTAVGSEVDLAGALMAHLSGVAVLDAAAVATPIAQLAARLNAQFPDLILIVAGGLNDQGALAHLIADGSVHRFLHKPLSEQRIRLFVGAAWRRHEEAVAGARAALSGTDSRHRTRTARGWLLGILACTAALAFLAWRALQAPATPGTPASQHTAAAAVASDAALEDLLARADRALEAGTLVTPLGENAAQLYREAQGRNARDPRAANGLEEVINKLLAAASEELRAGHLDAAQRLCDQARGVNPEHPRTAFLAAQIGAQRERVVLGQAQHAAAGGDLGRALAVLDNAARGAPPSQLATEARAELARAQVDARIAQFLQLGRDALEHGQLIEPTENNARFYIESARALSPNNPATQQALQDLHARLLTAANEALAAGNAERADYWAMAAADAGADPVQVAKVREAVRQLRSTATAETLTHLSTLFNQRLSQGKLIEPETDSARYYLAQLMQADAAHPSTQLAHAAFAARLLDEAGKARLARDYPQAQQWLTQARTAGADSAAVAAIDAQLAAARTTQPATAQPDAFVNASVLRQTHYVAAHYPEAAQQHKLGGWVDVQFTVAPDGSVSAVSIVGAQPVGVFERGALDAVRHWHYQPLTQDGHAISQRARVRLKFEPPP